MKSKLVKTIGITAVSSIFGLNLINPISALNSNPYLDNRKTEERINNFDLKSGNTNSELKIDSKNKRFIDNLLNYFAKDFNENDIIGFGTYVDKSTSSTGYLAITKSELRKSLENRIIEMNANVDRWIIEEQMIIVEELNKEQINSNDSKEELINISYYLTPLGLFLISSAIGIGVYRKWIK